MLHPCVVSKEKKRKRKEISINDLAVLPSHDTQLFTFIGDS